MLERSTRFALENFAHGVGIQDVPERFILHYYSLYLVFNNLDAYIEKDGEDKYLVIAKTHYNGSFLGQYTEIWNKIREQIRLIIGDRVIEYSKDVMKIKFESDDDLPLDKILNIPVCVLITGGFFKEDSKYYSQILLNECYYDLINLFFYNDLINVKDFDASL